MIGSQDEVVLDFTVNGKCGDWKPDKRKKTNTGIQTYKEANKLTMETNTGPI